MVPPVKVVSITNELIVKMLLEAESESSVSSESLEESSELVLLNESLVLPQDMKIRLKIEMRKMYKTFFIYFPLP